MQQDTRLNKDIDNDKRRSGTDFIVAVVIFVVSVAAYITAWGYNPISARMPLIFLTPLVILSFVQIIRSYRSSGWSYVVLFFEELFKGKSYEYKKIVELTAWTIGLMLLIYLTGQYAGMAIFLVILLRYYSKEKWLLIAILTIVMVILFYLLFEMLFEVQLNRGLIYRIWRGYQIF